MVEFLDFFLPLIQVSSPCSNHCPPGLVQGEKAASIVMCMALHIYIYTVEPIQSGHPHNDALISRVSSFEV